MANIKSAEKRIQVAERNRLRNKSYRSAVRTLMKNAFTSVTSYVAEPTPEGMQDVQSKMSSAVSKIDKAVKKGVLHPNNGARKKARLARFAKQNLQTESASD